MSVQDCSKDFLISRVRSRAVRSSHCPRTGTALSATEPLRGPQSPLAFHALLCGPATAPVSARRLLGGEFVVLPQSSIPGTTQKQCQPRALYFGERGCGSDGAGDVVGQ